MREGSHLSKSGEHTLSSSGNARQTSCSPPPTATTTASPVCHLAVATSTFLLGRLFQTRAGQTLTAAQTWTVQNLAEECKVFGQLVSPPNY